MYPTFSQIVQVPAIRQIVIQLYMFSNRLSPKKILFYFCHSSLLNKNFYLKYVFIIFIRYITIIFSD